MIRRRPVTNALATLLATVSGLPVGRAKAPAGNPDPPYYLLYAMPLEVSGPPLADDNEDAAIVYQITSVSGPDPQVADSAGELDQTEWMADKAREVLLARDPATGLWLHQLAIPGVAVMTRSLESEPGGTNDPADAIITYVQRFRLGLTPA